MSLPVLLLAGCALWMSGASWWVRGALTPTVVMGEISLLRMGPVYSQNQWVDEDCQVVAPIVIGDPLQRVRHTGARLGMMTLAGASGKVSSKQRAVLQGNLDVSRAGEPSRWEPCLQFDLDRVPRSLGQITLSSSWVPDNGRPVPFRVAVRPSWFTRAPQTLHLEKVSWTPHQGDEGEVEITLRYGGAEKLILDDGYGSSAVGWKVAPVPSGMLGKESFPRFNLLYNWSPRLESPDGKYNSHLAKDAWVRSKFRAFFSAKNYSTQKDGPDVQAYNRSFPIQIGTGTARRNGNTITISHRVTGLNSHRGPLVFKSEIGVPGDGFLPVSCALTRGVAK